MAKKLLLFPITLLSIILMAIGSLCLGYSFVTVVLNNNYVEYKADIVKKESENSQESVVLEYSVEGQTYQGSFPFLDRLVGTRMVIGYNPSDPSMFHLGDQNSHFAMFVWGTFFLMLGLVITFTMRRFKRV